MQPKKPDNVAQTIDAIDTWERDVSQYEATFGKALDPYVKIGVVLSLAPTTVQNHCHLNAQTLKTYVEVRTTIVDFCRATSDLDRSVPIPMDISAIVAVLAKGKGKGKDGKKGKGNGN